MFNCQGCKAPTGPGVSPVMRVEMTRVTQYKNWSSEGEEIISRGWEIVKEIALCPACAKGTEAF